MNSDSPYFSRIPVMALGALLLSVLCGCGSRQEEFTRSAVSGNVLMDGKPLPQGLIRFVPVEGTPGPKISVPIIDGQFTADKKSGPVPGAHRIEIVSTEDGGYALDDEQAIPRLHEQGIKKIEVLKVPEIYNSQSLLSETVSTDGPNVFEFKLVSQSRR